MKKTIIKKGTQRCDMLDRIFAALDRITGDQVENLQWNEGRMTVMRRKRGGYEIWHTNVLAEIHANGYDPFINSIVSDVFNRYTFYYLTREKTIIPRLMDWREDVVLGCYSDPFRIGPGAGRNTPKYKFVCSEKPRWMFDALIDPEAIDCVGYDPYIENETTGAIVFDRYALKNLMQQFGSDCKTSGEIASDMVAKVMEDVAGKRNGNVNEIGAEQ